MMINRICLLAFACASVFPHVAPAAVINGGFETGTMSGWTVSGSGATKTSASGITPPAGTFDGYIESTGNFAAVATIVAGSLGIGGPAIMGLGQGTPVNGSGISQSVSVSAGDVLSFDWNFISDELNEAAPYNDFTFYTISGSAFLLSGRIRRTDQLGESDLYIPLDWDLFSRFRRLQCRRCRA